MLKSLIICLFVSSVIALNLAPINMSPIITREFHLTPISADGTYYTNQLTEHLAGTDIVTNKQFIEKMGTAIALAVGIDGTEVKQMRWETQFTTNVGTLKLYGISASVCKNDIHVIAKSIVLSQPLPIRYKQVTQCARTGSRQFGFVGRRARECSTVNVPLDLSAEEIQEVTNKLIAKIPDTMHLLN